MSTNTTHTTDLQSSLHQNLRDLAKQPDGFATSDVSGFSPEIVYRAAQALVKNGELHRARAGGRRVRYFGSAAQAARQTAAPNARAARRAAPLGPRSKAPWSVDEPGLITAQTKITKAPPLPDNVYRTSTYPQY